jgi:capsular exopolysaccharide synthesis family protein
VPREPVLPQTARDLFRAFLTGCLAAVALAFAFEYLDNRIKSPEEIRAHLGLPFLGLVPAVPENGTYAATPLLNNGVPPNFAEALKTIRTAVVFSSPDETAKTILVTSTGPHEGKTLVASNLAAALAQAGQRTLIVDCDMRRPRVHEVFDVLQEPGLSNLLIESHSAGVTLRPTDIPNLMVLPAGHIPPNPAELLGSRHYRALLRDLGEQFDWVILDAPPVMAVTDASVLANTAGGVVFVVGSEMTSRATASTALEQLATAKARIIGAVLNRVDVGRHSYYYATYYRKEYAKYYQHSATRG